MPRRPRPEPGRLTNTPVASAAEDAPGGRDPKKAPWPRDCEMPGEGRIGLARTDASRDTQDRHAQNSLRRRARPSAPLGNRFGPDRLRADQGRRPARAAQHPAHSPGYRAAARSGPWRGPSPTRTARPCASARWRAAGATTVSSGASAASRCRPPVSPSASRGCSRRRVAPAPRPCRVVAPRPSRRWPLGGAGRAVERREGVRVGAAGEVLHAEGETRALRRRCLDGRPLGDQGQRVGDVGLGKLPEALLALAQAQFGPRRTRSQPGREP